MTKLSLISIIAAAVFLGCGDDKTAQTQQAQTVPQKTAEQNKTEAKQSVSYASKCASCHGEKGEGKAGFPKLAGQSETQIADKLYGYQSGTYGNERKNIMVPQAKSLSREDIKTLAQTISKF